MDRQKIETLLDELSRAATEPVRPELAEDIKGSIPYDLGSHSHARDAINIIIDFRINKLAAAAAIITIVVLYAGLFGIRGSGSGGAYEDNRLLIKYYLGGERATRTEILAGMSRLYQRLVHQEKDVVYYGDSIDLDNKDAVLMHWRLPDGSYKVAFADLRTKIVSAEELIKLQAQMLQK